MKIAKDKKKKRKNICYLYLRIRVLWRSKFTSKTNSNHCNESKVECININFELFLVLQVFSNNPGSYISFGSSI